MMRIICPRVKALISIRIEGWLTQNQSISGLHFALCLSLDTIIAIHIIEHITCGNLFFLVSSSG